MYSVTKLECDLARLETESTTAAARVYEVDRKLGEIAAEQAARTVAREQQVDRGVEQLDAPSKRFREALGKLFRSGQPVPFSEMDDVFLAALADRFQEKRPALVEELARARAAVDAARHEMFRRLP